MGYSYSITKEIRLSDFHVRNVLFAQFDNIVFLVKHKDFEKYFAIKAIDGSRGIKEENNDKRTSLEKAINERNFLVEFMKLKNPFLIKIEFAFFDVRNLYIGTEYMQCGSLLDNLEHFQELDIERVKFYAIELLITIDFLHKKNISHGNIKLDHILLDDKGHIKLTGFNKCKYFKKYKERKTFNDEELIDWHDFGAILYYLLLEKRKAYILSKNFDMMNDLKTISEVAYNLVQKLLNKEFKSVEQIKNEQFFDGVNWIKYEKMEIKPPYERKFSNKEDCSCFPFSKKDNLEKIIRGLIECPIKTNLIKQKAKELKNYDYISINFRIIDT